MINPLKDFLRPKYVVGLQVKDGFIGAVQLYVGLKGPEIDKAVFREVTDLEQVQVELKKLFQEEGFKREMIVTSLASSKAFIREISLPLSHPKKVEKIIKYQMEPYLPCPVEEVLVDFLSSGGNGSILTFGVEKKYLAEHLALLAGAGVEPDSVTLDDIALFSLYLYKHGGESEQPIAIVNHPPGQRGPDRRHLPVLQNETPRPLCGRNLPCRQRISGRPRESADASIEDCDQDHGVAAF
jgi:hypothetical protein